MAQNPSSDLQPSLRTVRSKLSTGEYLREVASRRAFIRRVPRNELASQNMDTVLGNLWFLVNPALLTLVYFFVFGVLLDARRGVDDYLIYLVSGVLVYQWLSVALSKGARAMSANVSLVRSLYFPRAILPITSSLTSLYTFLPSVGVVVVLAVGHGRLPTWRWLLLPVILVLTAAFILGLVFMVARLGHRLPDLHSLLPHLLRLGFYASGALYAPATLTDNDGVLVLFDANPVYEALSLWRWAIIGFELDHRYWLYFTAWSIVSLAAGFQFFRSAETTYGAQT